MELIFYFIILLSVVALAGILNKKFFSGQEKRTYRYQRKDFFMTRAEHEFYDVLDSAVGDRYSIFAQVHLPTIVDHKVKGQNWRGAFRHIDEKSVDFVLCDKAYLKPVLAIELDDKSHDEGSRKLRDEEVERIIEDEAGVPLLRIRNHGSFDVAEIARAIDEKLAASVIVK